MKKHLILVAAGRGVRAGGDVPKQFRVIGQMPVYMHALMAFARAGIDSAVIVAHESMHARIAADVAKAGLPMPLLTTGGETRWHSVSRGLQALHAEAGDLVAVHDAARPFISPEVIERGWQTAAVHGAGVPVVPVTDSLRHVTDDGLTEAVDRSRFRAVQTPQVFRHDILADAYALPYHDIFTDDASVVEAAGHTVTPYPGDSANIKITNPEDFIIAEYRLESKR